MTLGVTWLRSASSDTFLMSSCGQHALALQGPESFEDDADERDRADDDRPMNGPPARTSSHMGRDHTGGRAPKGSLQAPPGEGIARGARDARARARPSVPKPSSIAPSRRVSRTWRPTRASARASRARECECGDTAGRDRQSRGRSLLSTRAPMPCELACRLMSTTSLASAPGRRAPPGRARPRRRDRRLAEWRVRPPTRAARSSRPPGPAAKVWNSHTVPAKLRIRAPA